MNKLNFKLSLFSVLALVAFEPQNLQATSSSAEKEIDSQKPQKSIPLESFNPIQETLQKLNNGQYFSNIFLKNFANTHLKELKQFESKITPDDDLFDSWITLILRTSSKSADFESTFKIAQERGESEQASPAAQNNLGFMYYHGQGIDEDFTKAFEYYKLAADQGHATAQNNLGYMYRNGKGVDKNLRKAIEYYHKAAKQGYITAHVALGYMYQSGEGIAEDLTKVFEYYKKAADQEDSSAQMHLGLMYQNAIMVEQDLAQSLKWFLAFSRINDNISIKYDIEDLVTFMPSTITIEDEANLINNRMMLKDNIEVFLGLHGMEKGINQPDSTFKEREFAIPSLVKNYQEILNFEGVLLKVISAYFQSGFMVTCLQPKDINAFKSSRCPDIRYYELQGKSFLTFGKDNIEAADKLRDILLVVNETHSFYNGVSELLEIYKQRKRKYQIKAMNLQSQVRQKLISEDQYFVMIKTLADYNASIKTVEQEIEPLTQLQAIPQQLQDLLINGAPVRNRLFLQNNEHIEPIFQD